MFHGEALQVMDYLIGQEIKFDAIITDPPYGTMNGAQLDGWKHNKTSWDTAIPPKTIFIKANKLLRENGVLILFSQEPYTSNLRFNQILNLPFSYPLIWYKDHFANALIAKKAPVSYFEDISVFFKKYDDDLSNELRKYSKRILNELSLTVRGGLIKY